MFAVFIGAIIGTVLGLLAGYYEGWWDRFIMRICDVLFAFPGILLAIAVVAVLGSGIANVIVAVAIFSIPAFARLVRGNTLVLKQQTFIESARSIGASDTTILFSHILPGNGLVNCGFLYDAYRYVNYFRGKPVISRIRRAAANAGVGSDAQ
ncbi:ABC transporter permease [Salmonella enterica subsp. enterica]|nr:ABC transporter permease [Salmonella enterica subsp. enterica]